MHLKLIVEKLHSFVGHQDSLYALDYANGDDFFFSAAGDGMVVKWNLNEPAKGELIAKVPNSIYALHRLANPERLLAGQNYEGIHLLNWHNKQEVKSLKLSNAYIFDIKSIDNLIFIASGDGVVTVVDLLRWVIVATIQESPKSARCIAINYHTNELAIGYSDHHIRIFDLATFKKKNEFLAHQNSVFALCYSGNSNELLSGSRDAKIKVWEVNSDYALRKEIAAHLYAINSIAFSPNGKYFASGSMDKSIKIWDSQTHQLLKVVDKARHAGHGTSVNKIVWTDNNHLLSAGDDRTINYWRVEADH